LLKVKPINFIYNPYSADFPKMEAEILSEIKEAEKKADEAIERAQSEKESIIQEAMRNSSKYSARSAGIDKLNFFVTPSTFVRKNG